MYRCFVFGGLPQSFGARDNHKETITKEELELTTERQRTLKIGGTKSSK